MSRNPDRSLTIDTHHHILPDFFWQATENAHAPVGGLAPLQCSKEASISFMDDAGIDVAVVSLSTPGVHTGDSAKARARSDDQSAFNGFFANKWLWGAVLLALLLQVAVVYLPSLQQTFSTVSLSLRDWLWCAGVASSVLWLRELSKRVRRRYAAHAVLFLVVMPSFGCLGARYIRTTPGSSPIVAGSGATEGHVVLISIDGLRPDAIATFNAPTLNRLIREGSYTLSATTVFPSKTLPSHASMLTGQPPAVHGILWDTTFGLHKKKIDIPTVFSLLRSRGYTTAAFFSKAKFSEFQSPGAFNYSEAPGGWFGSWSADRTVRDLDRYLTSERPNLLFIHLAEPDHAGHQFGFMSEKYGEAVKLVDSSVDRILALAERDFGKGNFTMIVTADHGGHDRDHGSQDLRDVTIPWVAWGRGVKPGKLVQGVKTMDTAATVLNLLGVPEPANWVGKPVIEAFERGTFQ